MLRAASCSSLNFRELAQCAGWRRGVGANAKVRKDVGVADKRKLGQQTDANLQRGVLGPHGKCCGRFESYARMASYGPTRPTILGEHRKDLVKSIRRTQTVTRGNQQIPRAHQDEGPRERQAEGRGWNVGWLGARKAATSALMELIAKTLIALAIQTMGR